ncbi:flagellar hook-basal body protein [Fictibacillus macauensis]|nr:flagellar hook-basal body protein [Fictibacillus macauensis]
MLRGFYTAGAGMIAQQRRYEMISNNVANVNTPGYKEDQGTLRAFPKMLLHAIERSPQGGHRQTPIGTLATGVYMQEGVLNFAQGDLRETAIATDAALQEVAGATRGTLVYKIQTADGQERYTRNGHFAMTRDGFLGTQDGQYVVDERGRRIAINNASIKIAADGTVTNEDGTTQRIAVVEINQPNRLVKEGTGLLRLTEGGQARQATPLRQYEVKQGFIERSNVDPQRAMTDMMGAYRTFEANQKVLQTYDRSMEKAVNEVGRV